MKQGEISFWSSMAIVSLTTVAIFLIFSKIETVWDVVWMIVNFIILIGFSIRLGWYLRMGLEEEVK